MTSCEYFDIRPQSLRFTPGKKGSWIPASEAGMIDFHEVSLVIRCVNADTSARPFSLHAGSKSKAIGSVLLRTNIGHDALIHRWTALDGPQCEKRGKSGLCQHRRMFCLMLASDHGTKCRRDYTSTPCNANHAVTSGNTGEQRDEWGSQCGSASSMSRSTVLNTREAL